MKNRWVWLVVALNLIGLIALVFIYPHLMVSPGPVIAAHADIATDCFACHAPLRGVAAQRCTVCHALPDIGLRTTKGVALSHKPAKAAFHQDLVQQDCATCHSDHAGPKLSQQSRKPFSHALLRPAVRTECNNCHKAPDNKLHKNIQGTCSACHTQAAWKPATFEHDKFFELDRDHNVECVTCHIKNDYTRYTCYGCHEHTVQNVLREHREEGIRDLDNCVRCHKRPDGEGREGDD